MSDPRPPATPTPADDEAVDRLLRDAGARLRSTASDLPTPRPRLEDRRRRWVVPITLGAVAAAVALVIGITATTEETIQQVPAVTPVVTDPGLETVPPTVPDAGPVTSTPSDPTTPEPTAGIAVSDVGWDGPGSACLTIDGAVGCLPGGIVTEAGPAVAVDVLTTAGRWRTSVSLVGSEVRADPPAAMPDIDELELTLPAWLVHVAESTTGDGVLYGTLPSAPAGEVVYEAVSVAGETLPLTLLTDAIDGTDDGDIGVRVFETTFDVAARTGGEGVILRCVLAAPGDGVGWYESCAIPEGPPGARGAVFVHDGRALLLDAGNERVIALGDAPLRTNGCDTPVRDLLAASIDQPVMMGGLACAEERAVASGRFGAVLVQQGPPDGGLVSWERDDAGAWLVADTGTGIEPDPLALPIPPGDVVTLDAGAAATATGNVTEMIRTWMGEQPGATIAEAIALGEAALSADAPIGTEVLVSTGIIPTLTVVEVTYPDDSTGGARYAVWTTEPDDGSDPVLSAYRWFLCTRGVTDVDGTQVCV
jgi:hypothetical protein